MEIIDYFGKEVILYSITNGTFSLNVRICTSTTFFSLVTGNIGDMTIAGPNEVRKAYRSASRKGIDNVISILTPESEGNKHADSH